MHNGCDGRYIGAQELASPNNWDWKHQEAPFVSDIVTLNGRGIALIYTESWNKLHKSNLE